MIVEWMSAAGIRLATDADFPKLIEHYKRHHAENGRDGDLIFAPYEDDPRNFEDVRTQKSKKWSLAPTEIGWGRTWLLVEDANASDAEVYGEIQLIHQPPLKSALHRASLAMGMERSHRGQGWGSKMMEAALAWARSQSTLDWIQLYVFEHNGPARALYRKFGFKEVGSTPDMFRVHGKSVSDIEMILKLR